MELTTEQKIIEAAKIVFTKKGYAATRTRDIAEEAGLNLALLNYYFRSKENLFRIIIEDKFKQLFGIIMPILIDKNVALEEKIKTLVNHYTDLLLENEDLPIFVLNELKTNTRLMEHILQNVSSLTKNVIESQLQEKNYTLSTPNFIVNVISLSLFPFVTKPLFISAGLLTEDNFDDFVIERKRQIPIWMMQILKKSPK